MLATARLPIDTRVCWAFVDPFPDELVSDVDAETGGKAGSVEG